MLFYVFIFCAKSLTCHRNKDNGIWQEKQMLYVGIRILPSPENGLNKLKSKI